MNHLSRLCLVAAFLLPALLGRANAAPSVTLAVFAAGTLARPFRELDRVFAQQYPNVAVEPQFAGSVKLARQITELGAPCDVFAVADYTVIPKYLFAAPGRSAFAAWYAGFARNAITFVYTGRSRYAGEITAQNWYQVLARPGVEIGRSNPDTDPSGYQTLQMLDLAERYYRQPGLAARILANAPKTNMRDTETELLAVLEAGDIDYLAIYRSDALQRRLRHLELPAAIDLGDPADARRYATAVVATRNGPVAGRPIVYAVTVPVQAKHQDWAEKYVALLLGPIGQRIMAKNGFGGLASAYAEPISAVPPALRPLVAPWPRQ